MCNMESTTAHRLLFRISELNCFLKLFILWQKQSGWLRYYTSCLILNLTGEINKILKKILDL